TTRTTASRCAASRPRLGDSSAPPASGHAGRRLLVPRNRCADMPRPTTRRLIAAVVVAGLLCSPRALLAQSFKVGSFTKSQSGPCPAPCAQTVAHGLGIAPTAIIFWTSGKTSASGTNGSGSYLLSFGFTDGTTSGSIGTSSLDATGSPTDKRYLSSKAIKIIATSRTAAGEADMQATPWDATNFYLTWTANDANAYIVHFLAIGGSGVQAKVKKWSNPGATGLDSITGIGFQPSLVFHIHAYGSIGCGCPNGPILHGGFGLGVMDAGGHQWGTTFWNEDGGAKTNTQRGQQTNAALYAIHDTLVVQQRGAFQSMDADGFTLN